MDLSPVPNFDDTSVAYSNQSTAKLRSAYLVFSAMNNQVLSQIGPQIMTQALRFHLPVKSLIRSTIFRQFCGGESIAGCQDRINELADSGVESILDYSAEGAESGGNHQSAAEEIQRAIEESARNPSIPFAVFKPTALASLELLERVAEGVMSPDEERRWQVARSRIRDLCLLAHRLKTRVMIDAEETWIQPPIDTLVLELMRELNREHACVYTTAQMYRRDRFQYLNDLLKEAKEGGFHIGVKLVRGAYLEKERARATELGITSPLHASKVDCDRDYDRALTFLLKNIDRVGICVGTHNEYSVKHLVHEMDKLGLDPRDERIYCAQLLGMSDNLTFNLAKMGYRSAKYMPYGPVQLVMPYLVRRAEENSAVKGQSGRDLDLIRNELNRRATQ